MDKILEVSNLRKEYDNFTLNDINFSLDRGYIMGFIGPNGAGKSTTIKLIMNLIKKTSGEIRVFGKDNVKNERDIKEKIGFVYDESHFYEDLKVDTMKNIIASFYKNWNENLFKKYIRDFDINPKKKIKELSKGMKTKFQLAIALSHNAELIIMDEPTAGLDPIFRREILDILIDTIQDERKSVFFSTHITTDLDRIADYVTFINNGKMIFSQNKDEILENYAIVRGGLDLLNDENKKYFIGVSKNSFGFEAIAKNKNEVKRIFKDKCIIERPTLEDIMIHTVRGERNV
ncbi:MULTISPECIES: ABC transporter ATP-binding protein [Clostridium]|uniref:ABC transporter, ATP-binding protein n=1 Tax=Clostridium novyi (strain NT) TaxID=386415 RepID=A0Q1K5_CLONN|nr:MULTISPECIES: ABC transporter ATP-binding protein [Clostridium]ABK61415.1 ABC transporter, ATP-binding protein [Clostridium novyi NT]KEH88231.1 sodium ABC transporter ATP-binding protein [Clostridium novyi A str. NCTC 538]KEH89430.1 sodium ABC transporter ATP-binding protein [Clostridium novyi A str. 4540]KEH91350.1 sodium ABC transporter ATP-binding protein [Clostridium novyi A str. BKT29909]KEH94219.1 sodium ABC transporter ATP-binding protein [Clostridium botulinum C/D str. It1]